MLLQCSASPIQHTYVKNQGERAWKEIIVWALGPKARETERACSKSRLGLGLPACGFEGPSSRG